MSALVVTPIAPTDWPAVAAGFADLGFEQGASYAEAAARRIGAHVQYCLITEAGQSVAAAAIRVKTVPGLGRGIAWIASGPLVRPSRAPAPNAPRLGALFAALRTEICDRQGHLLRFRLSGTAFLDPADVARAVRAAGFHPTPRALAYCSYVLPLAQETETLMANLNGKWRGHLRKALKAGLTLDLGTGPAHQQRFQKLFDRVQRTKGFERPDILPSFHYALEGADYRCETLIAQKDGEDTAGIIIGGSGPCAVYLFGATDEAGRQHRAGYFLAWHGFARARDLGFEFYDMGGVDFAANPAVAEFKERTGGLPVLTEAFEARPEGLVGRVLPRLEALRTRLKGKR